jgi:hypothetical protein
MLAPKRILLPVCGSIPSNEPDADRMGLPLSLAEKSLWRPFAHFGLHGKPQSLVMKKSKRKRNNEKNQKERKLGPGRKTLFFASAFGTEKEWSQSHKGKKQRTHNRETTRTKGRRLLTEEKQ